MRRSRQPNVQSPPVQQRVSRGTVALLGGLCAVAVLLSGVVIAGFVAPDQLRTTAISAAAPENENPVSAAAAAPAPTVAPKPVPVEAASVSTAKVDRPVPSVVQPVADQKPTVAPLATADTRWGNAVASPQGQVDGPAAAQTDVAPRVAAGPDERDTAQTGTPAAVALADLKTDPAPDASATASISATDPGNTDDVQVAESEAEVAKLEADTGMMGAQPTGAAAAELPLPAMKTARVTKYVNLRAGPADESRVIAVVPANAEVKVESGCQWCTVVYNGQRGYIYKSFIRRSLKEAAAEGTGLF